METVSGAANIWEHGNAHLKSKLKFFSPKMAIVVKYVISKMRKYNEFFESNKTIANECGVSVRTTINAIKRAEKLGIFEVSTRFEKTLNGAFRQTSNLIKLKKFENFDFVQEVKTTVRKAKSAIRTVVNTAKSATKKASESFTPKRQQNTYNKPHNAYNPPVRVEVKPDWLHKPYVPPQISDKEQRAFEAERDALQRELREKYGKK